MPINLEELANAMSDFASGATYLFDTETGEIIRVRDYEREKHILLKKLDLKHPEKYVIVPKLESKESYQFMADYIKTQVKNESLKKRLEDAISKDAPFRRFNEIVYKHPQERIKWLEYKKQRIIEKVKEWLDKLGVDY